MKKLIALLLVLATMMAFAACGKKEEAKAEPVEALAALQTAWNALGDEEKPFAMGGGYETMVDNAPGSVPTTDEAYLTNILLVPAEELNKVSAAASVMHAMNTNTFACGALKLVEGADEAAVAKAIVDAILNTRWMCGFPERVVVVSTNGCLVVAFGHEGNITNLNTAITAVDATATVLHSEAISG